MRLPQPVDVAFNRYGDLFTYDADMEWDINTPWYRPTRVCQAAERLRVRLAQRRGQVAAPTTPTASPPSSTSAPARPPASPSATARSSPRSTRTPCSSATGATANSTPSTSNPGQFGLHGRGRGVHHRHPAAADRPRGQPAPTARCTSPSAADAPSSGLYRVTYAGTESDRARSPGDSAEAEALRVLRRKLEAFHGQADPNAVATSWPYLGHPDRFIRFAARVAIEFQDPPNLAGSGPRRDKTPPPPSPPCSPSCRVGDKSAPTPPILEALDGSTGTTLERVPAASTCSASTASRSSAWGRPTRRPPNASIARFDPHYPARIRELNAELAKMLIYLQDPDRRRQDRRPAGEGPHPGGADRVRHGPPRPQDRLDPRTPQGVLLLVPQGRQLQGRVQLQQVRPATSRTTRSTTLTDDERTALKPILDAEPVKTPVAVPPARPFVKAWTLDDLVPARREGPRPAAETSTEAAPCSPPPTASPATASTTKAAPSAPTSPASPAASAPATSSNRSSCPSKRSATSIRPSPSPPPTAGSSPAASSTSTETSSPSWSTCSTPTARSASTAASRGNEAPRPSR